MTACTVQGRLSSAGIQPSSVIPSSSGILSSVQGIQIIRQFFKTGSDLAIGMSKKRPT